MRYQDILYETDGGVATITLNRPEQLNGFTTQMRAELLHAFRRAPQEARALVVTGAGRGFCSGQDLGAAKHAAEVDSERVLREEYLPVLMAIEESDIPILCAVNGPAAGAGANLALACDVVVAARSAYFMQAFARIGLMPDVGGTYRLPRLVGQARAMGAALFAEKIPADQALDWGMIWDVVEDDALASHVNALARRLAEGPTRAYAEIRKAIRASFDHDYETQLALEGAGQGRLDKTRDFAEGVAAFLDKRAPVFEGR